MIRFQRLQLSQEKFDFIWNALCRLDGRSLTDDANTPAALWAVFQQLDALHFEVCDVETDEMVGIATLSGITKWSATIHLTFFDRRLRGRERESKLALRDISRELGLTIVHVYTPDSHRATIAWLQRIGFVRSGVIPRALRRNGVFFDHVVLYITKEELEVPYGIHQTGFEAGAVTIPGSTNQRGGSGVEATPDALHLRVAATGAGTVVHRLATERTESVPANAHRPKRRSFIRSLWYGPQSDGNGDAARSGRRDNSSGS